MTLIGWRDVLSILACCSDAESPLQIVLPLPDASQKNF